MVCSVNAIISAIRNIMKFSPIFPVQGLLSVSIALLTGMGEGSQTIDYKPKDYKPTFTPMSEPSSTQSSLQIATANSNCAVNHSRESNCRVGGLFVQSRDRAEAAFILKHTAVKAKIAGNISRVEVSQQFENPFTEPLEAVYVFPLPDEAAVDDMEIKIGDRVIKSDIKRREEAQEIYDRAKQQGRTAGLLEQERDNIFTQSLANIKPGEKIEVTIRYTDSLKFQGGDYEFVFPMVVGPRYIPGTPIPNPSNSNPSNSNPSNSGVKTDRVPDGDRINPPLLPQNTRSGHDINVSVEIDAGLPISNIRSTSHKIQTVTSGNIVSVQLGKSDTIPNKDLILRYRVAGDNTQATVLTQSDKRGGHFALYLIPALQYKTNQIVPKDVVFLMDTSGSQQGEPLVKSKELMRRFIKGLNSQDTFTIIDFANTAKALSSLPLANTEENRQKALNYIEQLQANGGTELLNGIQAVMNFPAADSGRLRSVVLITDGYIGNENEVISQVQRSLKPGNRLYSFGVGSSVNRFLLNRLADVGRGTSVVVRQDEPTQEIVEKFFVNMNNPVLTNIELTWEGGGEKPEIYPLAAPDLFANQPLVLFGRKGDRSNGQLRIRGNIAGGKRYEKIIPVNFNSTVGTRQRESNLPVITDFGNPAIAQLWGRFRIKELMSQMFGGDTKSVVESVTDTALNYRLLSQYTAFIAVSEEVRVEPDGTRRRVQVPVELPEGVSYDAFPEPQEEAQMNTRGPAGVRNFSAYPSAPFLRPTPMPKARLPRQQETREKVNTSNLEVLSIEGLDGSAIASLTQHLKGINLVNQVVNQVGGDLVLELLVKDGQVERIVLDDRVSTMQQKDVIDTLKRSLFTWQSPTGLRGKIRIKLRIIPMPN
ncbi:trypsin [Oscillatoriales cyanobacterium USR001]|nr:trypsin [Oscillatoriales cyanobacterium USR001]